MPPHEDNPPTLAVASWLNNEQWMFTHAATLFCICDHGVDSYVCSVVFCDLDEACPERHGIWRF